MARVTLHGHATCTLETDDGTRIVIDPFFEGNPACDLSLDDVGRVDYILVTHGHGDHFSDCVALARKTGATVVSTFEVTGYCERHGVQRVHGMNVGGGYDFPFGRVKMTIAVHSASIAGDDAGGLSSIAGGFHITFGDRRFYHAGDTALTRDLELLRGEVDVAMLPIGDNFTMGPDDAVKAVEMIAPEIVIPMHYNTWDLIAQDPEAFRASVGDRARVEILNPGESLDF